MSDHHHLLKASLETELKKYFIGVIKVLIFKNSKLSCIQMLTKNICIAIVVSIKLVLLCPINMRRQKRFSGLLIIDL